MAAAPRAAASARVARAKTAKPASGAKRTAPGTTATSVNGRLWAGGWQD